MSLTRAFIALEIPNQTHQKISNQTANLRKNLDSQTVRWVPADNIHLTLKFLGDISRTQIEQISQVLSVIAGRHIKHLIKISELGAFPNIRRPRVIWIGIQAPETLNALYQELEGETAKMEFPPEKRSFNPHLTIGRVKQHISQANSQALQNALSSIKIGYIDTVEVEALHLFKSDLKPSGAVYTKLYSAALNKPLTR